MIINGRQIASSLKEDIARHVKKTGERIRLAVVIVGENPVVESFVGIKKKFGEAVGIDVVLHEYPREISEQKLIDEIRELATKADNTALIVQLPLPVHFDVDRVLNAIPAHKDADVLTATAREAFASGDGMILPPVAGAVEEICKHASVDIGGKNTVVIGRGRLVGQPVEDLLKKSGAKKVTVVDRSDDLSQSTLGADIIVSGAGEPGLIRPDMISDGTVLIDAGTSEVSGRVRGDADPLCADKCSVFTPVPGGVGPVTVAILFRNVVRLHEAFMGAVRE